MTTYASIQCLYVALQPTDPASVPEGCLYLDSTNGNAASIKGPNAISPDYFLKTMIAGDTIGTGRPLSKTPTGTVIEADAQGTNTETFVGWALAAATSGQTISVLLAGANLTGALAGLGFSTGQTIYLSDTGGYTNNPASLQTGDTIIKLGIADCAASTSSNVAVDLIGLTEVLISP